MAIAKQSGSAPFYKVGPLYAHGPNGTHPIDPKKEAAKKAETNASNAKKVYGKTTKTQTTDEYGLTTHTFSTPYTQSGQGSASTKKSYKQFKAEGGDVEAAKKFNAEKVNKGVKTRSHQTFDLKPSGIVPLSSPPKADVKITTPPKKEKPSFSFSMNKKSGKGGSIKLGSNRVKKTKSRSGNSCGCS